MRVQEFASCNTDAPSMRIHRRNSCMWRHICSSDDLMPSRKGSKNLVCSGAERWIDFFQKNSMRPVLPALSSWPSRRDETGAKARLCRCEHFPSALNEFQGGCLLHSRVYLASNSAAKCYDAWRLQVVKAKYSTACVSLAGCGQRDAWEHGKRRHASRHFLLSSCY